MLDGSIRRVLLVEDNAADADYIEALLHEHVGNAVRLEQAETLAEGAHRLSSGEADPTQRFDALLLDLRLPDGEGLECVHAMQRADDHVAIVVLTGLDDEELAIRCVAAGAQDYLSKQELRPRALWRALRYAVARVREATAHRHAEELRARLASIVEASCDAIVSCTPDGMITSWNGAAARMFGPPLEHAIGQPASEVICAIEDPATGEPCAGFDLIRGRGRQTQETLRLKHDLDEMYLSVMSSALTAADGTITGWSAICRDITVSRRQGDELKRRNDQLTERDQQLRALLVRVHEVREEERKRISREVHDQLGQLLTGFKMDLRWLLRRLERGEDKHSTPAMVDRLREAETLVDETVATVQRIAIELRPSALDALGLAAAIRDEARRFEARTGLRTSVRIDMGLASPKPELVTGVFRIMQELLTNVARHAHANTVDVELRARETALTLRVEDDGVGIDDDSALRASSLGLLGVRERARALGGIADVGRRGAHGTIATVSVPL